VCACTTRVGCERLDLARRRAGAAAVLVRPFPSVRRRAAPRHRHRRAYRFRGAGAGRGSGVVRRDGPGGRKDGLDPDSVWLYRHARAPRFDRRKSRRARRRGIRRGNHRPERRRRWCRAVRLLRRPHDERSAGLRRSAHVPAATGGAGSGGSGGAGARGATVRRHTVRSSSRRACCGPCAGGTGRARRPELAGAATGTRGRARARELTCSSCGRTGARRACGGAVRTDDRCRTDRSARGRTRARAGGRLARRAERRAHPSGRARGSGGERCTWFDSQQGAHIARRPLGHDRSSDCGDEGRRCRCDLPSKRSGTVPQNRRAVRRGPFGPGAALGTRARRRLGCGAHRPPTLPPPQAEAARHAPYHGFR
jgi:hypothetical protein